MSKISILYGFSYARPAGFIPDAFPEIEKKLIIIIEKKKNVFENKPKDPDLTQMLIDSYGKLGFLYYAREFIRHLNVKPSKPFGHYYHLYNFVYDCKAFLDSVAVMINYLYKLGEKGGNIDFKKESFRKKIASNCKGLMDTIDKYLKWILNVVEWRDALIHKFCILVTPDFKGEPGKTYSNEELDKFFQENPKYKMESKPIPFFGLGLKPYHGYKPNLVDTESFCDEWIRNASSFYNEICNAIVKKL